MIESAFVVGSTGYTGQQLVQLLRELDITTIAHVRPGSSQLDSYKPKLQSIGATLDTTPWQGQAMSDTLARLKPSVVFSLLGTTRKRAKSEGLSASQAYENIDYGLTAMLIDACVWQSPESRVVFLSSIGAEKSSNNDYLNARYRVEHKLMASNLQYTIARPSFITGDDRPEDRPAERIAASFGNRALSIVGALGARKLQARYSSLSGRELASGLLHAAMHPTQRREALETNDLRQRGQQLLKTL